MSYGLARGFHMLCTFDRDSASCTQPDQPHVIIHRDFEYVPWVSAIVSTHKDAQSAARKISEYLKDFDDEDTFIIHVPTSFGITDFRAAMDTEMKELMRQEEEDVRLTELQDEEGTQGSDRAGEAR